MVPNLCPAHCMTTYEMARSSCHLSFLFSADLGIFIALNTVLLERSEFTDFSLGNKFFLEHLRQSIWIIDSIEMCSIIKLKDRNLFRSAWFLPNEKLVKCDDINLLLGEFGGISQVVFIKSINPMKCQSSFKGIHHINCQTEKDSVWLD